MRGLWIDQKLDPTKNTELDWFRVQRSSISMDGKWSDFFKVESPVAFGLIWCESEKSDSTSKWSFGTFSITGQRIIKFRQCIRICKVPLFGDTLYAVDKRNKCLRASSDSSWIKLVCGVKWSARNFVA